MTQPHKVYVENNGIVIAALGFYVFGFITRSTVDGVEFMNWLIMLLKYRL